MTKQRLITLLMVVLLGFLGPLACVLHCTFVGYTIPSAPVGFVCQFMHTQSADMEQSQTSVPHFSPPALLPFAQLALPAFLESAAVCSLLLLLTLCNAEQFRLRPPTPPPRLLAVTA